SRPAWRRAQPGIPGRHDGLGGLRGKLVKRLIPAPPGFAQLCSQTVRPISVAARRRSPDLAAQPVDQALKRLHLLGHATTVPVSSVFQQVPIFAWKASLALALSGQAHPEGRNHGLAMGSASSTRAGLERAAYKIILD